MQIIFSKLKSKRNTLTCIREDGSRTWAQIHPGMEMHDLAHYAVETELGYQAAFYGLLKQGYDIGDFELPRSERPEALMPKNLPAESLITEHLVNLLQISFVQGEEGMAMLDTLRTILQDNHLPFPNQLTPEKLEAIQSRLQSLMIDWRKIPDGGTFELTFS